MSTSMYFIKKKESNWTVYNKRTGKRRSLTQVEVNDIMEEFPVLKLNAWSNQISLCRNRISSVPNLP